MKRTRKVCACLFSRFSAGVAARKVLPLVALLHYISHRSPGISFGSKLKCHTRSTHIICCPAFYIHEVFKNFIHSLLKLRWSVLICGLDFTLGQLFIFGKFSFLNQATRRLTLLFQYGRRRTSTKNPDPMSPQGCWFPQTVWILSHICASSGLRVPSQAEHDVAGDYSVDILM